MPILSQSGRRFFTYSGFIRAFSAIPGGRQIVAAMATQAAHKPMPVHTPLGLRPILNTSGTNTYLGSRRCRHGQSDRRVGTEDRWSGAPGRIRLARAVVSR
jgi:hypothetical protein